VQFNHRNMAYITQSVSMVLAYAMYRNLAILPPMVKLAGGLTILMINYQVIIVSNIGCERYFDSAQFSATKTSQSPPNDSYHDVKFRIIPGSCMQPDPNHCSLSCSVILYTHLQHHKILAKKRLYQNIIKSLILNFWISLLSLEVGRLLITIR
jgi:hypothetical protein